MRPEIIHRLTEGLLYCTACHTIFSHQLNSKPSQLCEVIQNLARRGFYISVGDEEVEINEDILSQTNPFSEVSNNKL